MTALDKASNDFLDALLGHVAFGREMRDAGPCAPRVKELAMTALGSGGDYGVASEIVPGKGGESRAFTVPRIGERHHDSMARASPIRNSSNRCRRFSDIHGVKDRREAVFSNPCAVCTMKLRFASEASLSARIPRWRREASCQRCLSTRLPHGKPLIGIGTDHACQQ
jgi:hypothetical protein